MAGGFLGGVRLGTCMLAAETCNAGAKIFLLVVSVSGHALFDTDTTRAYRADEDQGEKPDTHGLVSGQVFELEQQQ